MNSKTMQFLYGDRELLLAISDLLTSPVDVIVNSTDSGLLHVNDMANQILRAAGHEMVDQSRQLIRQYGEIEAGMAVYTTAGCLPYKAVIHTVAPRMGEGDEQTTIEQSISRSLLICETNAWGSIAFSALGVSADNIPLDLCAQAFFRAITSFWDARFECAVEKIVLCLSDEHFRLFVDAFRNDAIESDIDIDSQPNRSEDSESENIGYIDLMEEDIEKLNDDEIAAWFK